MCVCVCVWAQVSVRVRDLWRVARCSERRVFALSPHLRCIDCCARCERTISDVRPLIAKGIAFRYAVKEVVVVGCALLELLVRYFIRCLPSPFVGLLSFEAT